MPNCSHHSVSIDRFFIKRLRGIVRHSLLNFSLKRQAFAPLVALFVLLNSNRHRTRAVAHGRINRQLMAKSPPPPSFSKEPARPWVAHNRTENWLMSLFDGAKLITGLLNCNSALELSFPLPLAFVPKLMATIYECASARIYTVGPTMLLQLNSRLSKRVLRKSLSS